MAQPRRPPNLDPNHIYIHITSPSSPSTISSAFISGDQSLSYVGPVGELQGEHIFEVQRQGQAVKRDQQGSGEAGSTVVSALKEVEGVKGAKVLEVKQRAKRGEEL